MAHILVNLGAFIAGLVVAATIFYPIFAYLSVQVRGGVRRLPEETGIIIWGTTGIVISTITLAAGFVSESFWVGFLTYAVLWLGAFGAAALAVRHG